MSIILVSACLSGIVPAMAESIIQETPHASETVVPVGGVIWEKAVFDGTMGVSLLGPIRANWGSAETVDLPEGSNLIIIREKKLKACRQQTSATLGGLTVGGWKDCVIDKDEDGKFELVSFNEVGGAKRIDPPVAYTRGMIPLKGGSAKSFRQTITYLGKSGGDIRLSYREFSNDMARPAFTEDLTLPVPSDFPQTMLVKSIKFTVLGIDGNGLRYRLD